MCGDVVSPEEASRTAHSKLIDKNIKQDEQELSRVAKTTTKILLLGAGESGKSTILKQFKVIYGSGFTEEDVKSYRAAILGNVVLCAKALVTAMDMLQIPYGFQPAQFEARRLNMLSNAPLVSEEGDTNESRPEGRMPKVFDPLALIAQEEYFAVGGEAATPSAAQIVKQAVVFKADNLSEMEIRSIKFVWEDCGVQYCYKRKNEFQLLDCCG
ncbi:guanine nucleotide binding protein, alpha subunit [Chytriomyces sp. MP71]|nr:guanine nucleotide binding protein, alpha subunit [Chytriomyces sp. MP71]